MTLRSILVRGRFPRKAANGHLSMLRVGGRKQIGAEKKRRKMALGGGATKDALAVYKSSATLAGVVPRSGRVRPFFGHANPCSGVRGINARVNVTLAKPCRRSAIDKAFFFFEVSGDVPSWNFWKF